MTCVQGMAGKNIFYCLSVMPPFVQYNCTQKKNGLGPRRAIISVKTCIIKISKMLVEIVPTSGFSTKKKNNN